MLKFSYYLILLLMATNIVLYKSIIDYSFFFLPILVLLIITIKARKSNLYLKRFSYKASLVLILLTYITYFFILPNYTYYNVKDFTSLNYPNYDAKIFAYHNSSRFNFFVKSAYSIELIEKSSNKTIYLLFDSTTGKYTIIE